VRVGAQHDGQRSCGGAGLLQRQQHQRLVAEVEVAQLAGALGVAGVGGAHPQE
jgi:hypothetical protein